MCSLQISSDAHGVLGWIDHWCDTAGYSLIVLCFPPFFSYASLHCFHQKYWLSLMTRSNSKPALFFFKGLPVNAEGVVFHSIPFLDSQILVLIIGSKYE